jgi:hypothetical protein
MKVMGLAIGVTTLGWCLGCTTEVPSSTGTGGFPSGQVGSSPSSA